MTSPDEPWPEVRLPHTSTPGLRVVRVPEPAVPRMIALNAHRWPETPFDPADRKAEIPFMEKHVVAVREDLITSVEPVATHTGWAWDAEAKPPEWKPDGTVWALAVRVREPSLKDDPGSRTIVVDGNLFDLIEELNHDPLLSFDPADPVDLPVTRAELTEALSWAIERSERAARAVLPDIKGSPGMMMPAAVAELCLGAARGLLEDVRARLGWSDPAIEIVEKKKEI